MTDQAPRALVGLQRVMAAWMTFKLLVWALFLLVAPAMCLQRGLVGAAVLLGLLGLFLDLMAVDVLLVWARGWAPALRRWLMIYHLGVAIAAGYQLLQPIDPRWTWLPESDIPNTAVSAAPEGLLVLGGAVLHLYPRDAPPRSLEYPGPFAWISHAPGDGSVWVVPRDAPQMFRRVDGRWEEQPRAVGYARALVGGPSRLWLAVGTQLGTRGAGDDHWTRVDACPNVTGVAVAPDDEDQVLVVGRRWCASSDGGQTWTESTPPAEEFGSFPEPALGGGGWQYVYSSGHLSSTLHVRGPGESGFTARTAPASDVRVMVADPREGRRVWAGTWGEGVFVSDDGGESWSDFGLQNIQIRTMALDPIARTLAVASSNTIFNKGVYVRGLD